MNLTAIYGKMKKDWPPNFAYLETWREDCRQVLKICEDPRAAAKKLYENDPVSFINDFCITYDPRNPARNDPRNPGQKLKAKMPFELFPKQVELVRFLQSCISNQEHGLIEKCRDMGATWVACSFSVWMWVYMPGSSVGWGSRKEALVDRLGVVDSIFEKIRMIINELPPYILPEGFNAKEHMAYMKITGPHGASITGEAGDNIGRGGRTTAYFKDESAHYERPELIEASLGDNTDCQIDISSVNGPNNVFFRKRYSGAVKVFIMDWRDHPGKTQEWYDERRKSAESQGLMHLFSQEVDRDYNSSVEGVLIPGKWVKAAIDSHKKLGMEIIGRRRAGFDVADEGGDVNAIVTIHGVVVENCDSWGDGDTWDSTARAFQFCEENKISHMVYDSVGVGAGAKAAANKIKTPVKVIPYTGVGVRNPRRDYVKGKKNEDMFASGSAQDWWLLRDRFLATYNAVVKGKNIEHDKLISLNGNLPHLNQLVSELSQVIRETDGRGRIKINKSPKGTKSPNLADSLKMAMSEAKEKVGPRIRVI